MRRFIALCALAVALAGCSHAQLPPSTGYNVQWTVTIPAASGGWLGCGTGQPACSIVVSTLTVPAGTATCPASTGSNYTPQQTAATAISGTTWTQDSTTGLTMCAVAQLVQAQAVSAASVASSPVTSPALPLAPSVSGTQQSAALDPQLQPTPGAPVMASLKIVGGLVSSR